MNGIAWQNWKPNYLAMKTLQALGITADSIIQEVCGFFNSRQPAEYWTDLFSPFERAQMDWINANMLIAFQMIDNNDISTPHGFLSVLVVSQSCFQSVSSPIVSKSSFCVVAEGRVPVDLLLLNIPQHNPWDYAWLDWGENPFLLFYSGALRSFLVFFSTRCQDPSRLSEFITTSQQYETRRLR